jgi:lipopolysaccharide export LptBFGC system permease protein LptF
MRRILSRYLLQTFLPHFLLALGLMVSVLVMIFYVKLIQWAAEKGISLSWTVSSFGDLSPYLLSLAVPVAFLVAFLLTLGQLSESGEVMAMRASGFSFLEILTPFFWTALALSLFLLPLNHAWSPRGYNVFRDSFREGLREITRLDFEAKTLMDIGPFKLFAEEVDTGGRALRHVRLYRPGVAQGGARIEADRGSWQLLKGRGIELTLEDGAIQLPNTSDPERLAVAHFDRYVVYVPFITRGFARTPGTRELTSAALRERLRQTITEENRADARTELAVRTASAVSPLVFFCIAAPLGLRTKHRGRSSAFAWSLVVLFGFYALLSLGIIIGSRSVSLAPYAPWLGDATTVAAAALLARRSLR